MRALERYVDAQNGGPGMGWYRIVTSPAQARKVTMRYQLYPLKRNSCDDMDSIRL